MLSLLMVMIVMVEVMVKVYIGGKIMCVLLDVFVVTLCVWYGGRTMEVGTDS